METLGESCRLWRLGSGVSPANSARVHRLYRQVERARLAGEIEVRDVVPGYDSLAIHFDPLSTDTAELDRRVGAWLAEVDDNAAEKDESEVGEPVALPLRYDGPDLARVAERAGLEIAEVVERHARPTYTVAAIGFMPHFPYLLGLDPALATPRLDAPRVRVPAGSVAIGNDQTGVYPQESPGGWNLIGTTDPALLTALRPGDRVRFVAEGGVS
ncbi:MAG: allophanate hydrolase subunit 1 [Planctomycetota bacterium]